MRDNEDDKFLPLAVSTSSRVKNNYSTSRSGGSRGRNSKMVKSSDMLCNIRDLNVPYEFKDGIMSTSEPIRLCKKAYYNISIFKNTIDVQSEFANSKIFLRGGTKRSRQFFEAWLKEIKISKLTPQFFLEYYRSTNFFAYKVLHSLDRDSLAKLRREDQFNIVRSVGDTSVEIPLRYIVLDPESVGCNLQTSFFNDGKISYVKFLNETELSLLKKSNNEESKKFMSSLPEDVRKKIKNNSTNEEIYIDIEPDNLIYVSGKKQDYEPLAIPLYYPVLKDINFKLDLQRAEIAIARQVDYLVLLITYGEKGDVDPMVGKTLQSLFENESVSRVIVSDYTTKMDFVIPDFNKIMGSAKYEIVNRDIATGLMSMSFDEEKYANSIVKTKIFIERLSESRNAFLNNFLIPEMEEIGKKIGFKKIPTPHFAEIDIEDKTQVYKVYTRLVELGLLTPDEFFQAAEDGIIPDKESSEENQLDYLEKRKSGLYTPLIGSSPIANEGLNSNDGELPKVNGRPVGTKGIPQTKPRQVSPIGVSKANCYFSAEKIKDTAHEISKMISLAESKYKEVRGNKRLNSSVKNKIRENIGLVLSSTSMEDWSVSVASFIEKGTFEKNQEISNAIEDIMIEKGVDDVAATILYHSSVEVEGD